MAHLFARLAAVEFDQEIAGAPHVVLGIFVFGPF
jgi:hypothetical protein